MKEIIFRKINFLLLIASIILCGCKETAELLSIEIIKQPVKKEYLLGEKFDPTGMELVANYSDNTSALIVVTDNMLMYDFSTVGEKTVVISYKEKNATITGIAVFHPNDPILRYFGKWISEDRAQSYTLSFRELYHEYYDCWYRVSIQNWTVVTNLDNRTKDDYPSGLHITGFVSESNFLWIGQPFNDYDTFYLHKDGNSVLYWHGDVQSYLGEIFIKDE